MALSLASQSCASAPSWRIPARCVVVAPLTKGFLYTWLRSASPSRQPGRGGVILGAAKYCTHAADFGLVPCFGTALLTGTFTSGVSVQRVYTFGFEEGRNATEIAMAIRLLAAAGCEWRNDLVVYMALWDVKQAFDKM